MNNQQESRISAEILSIQSFFQLGKFVIPHYQRSYAWTESEVQALFNDITDAYRRGQSSYLLGSITTIKQNENNAEYEILDGQQRLTTFSLIFYNIFSHLPTEQFALKTSCQQIVFDKESPRILHGRIADKNIYRYLTLGQGQKKAHKLITTYDIINNYENVLKDINFVRFLLENVMFVWVNTYSLESAYQIFETLNDRSKALQKIDLVRNRLFHNMQKSQIETACGLWDDLYGKANLITNGKTADTHLQSIFTTYLEATQGVWIETKDLFFHVKSLLRNNQNDKNYPYNLFTKIASSFNLYMDVSRPGDSVGRISSTLDTSIIRSISKIKDLKISHAVLFALFDLLSRKPKPKASDLFILNSVILNLTHFIRRTRILGNLPAAKYGRELNALAKDIVTLEFMEQLSIDWFLDELKRIDANNKSIISDHNFITKLINTDIKSEIAKDILIDVHNNQRDTTGEWLNKGKDLHAEYICPQDLNPSWSKVFSVEDHEYYLNKLGNYALLGEVNSKEAPNLSFDDKKNIYSTACFSTTQDLVSKDSWTPEKIQARTMQLAQEIAIILSLQ